jgi:hypothetical protein
MMKGLEQHGAAKKAAAKTKNAANFMSAYTSTKYFIVPHFISTHLHFNDSRCYRQKFDCLF